MISRRFIKITFPFVLLVGIYFIGPEPARPLINTSLPVVPSDAAGLEQRIRANDQQHNVKPGNEATIIWADSSRKKTKYAVVYVHGFSASHVEGDPVHRRFAEEFGFNLFLPRMTDHGIDTTETLLYFTGDRYWESAKEALAIGRQLGEKVILMSTSSGSTLSFMLAAEYPDDVVALVNLSPNVALVNPAAFILNDPWGLYVARMVKGGKYNVTEATPEEAKYWNKQYRLEALTQLEELLEDRMTKETFARVKQPSLTLYYYKNEQEQDDQVKVSAMLEMNGMLATPDDLKVTKAMPLAGQHVIGSTLGGSQDVEGVYAEIRKFAVEKLKLAPIK